MHVPSIPGPYFYHPFLFHISSTANYTLPIPYISSVYLMLMVLIFVITPLSPISLVHTFNIFPLLLIRVFFHSNDFLYLYCLSGTYFTFVFFRLSNPCALIPCPWLYRFFFPPLLLIRLSVHSTYFQILFCLPFLPYIRLLCSLSFVYTFIIHPLLFLFYWSLDPFILPFPSSPLSTRIYCLFFSLSDPRALYPLPKPLSIILFSSFHPLILPFYQYPISPSSF